MDWVLEQARGLEALAPEFATAIGRPDLARRAPRVLPVGSSTSDRDSGLASQGAAQQVASTARAAGLASMISGGALSGGALAAITIGLVGFYVWTRGHQA